MAEKHVQTVKDLLSKARDSRQHPYLVMLEVRNTSVEGIKTLSQLICDRAVRSV